MKNFLNKILKILLVFIFLVSYTVIPIEAVEANNKLTPVQEHGKLSVQGTNITDENGNKFQLRGISTHGIAWFPEYVNQDAFIYMRDEWNINAVRLAMYSDKNSGYSESIHELVKKGVEYATNAGLYVIIDWHILSDGNPNINKNDAIKFFKEMATLYKDNVNVIYEICNEPNGDVYWERDIKPYAEEIISEIRKIDEDSIIVVGTPTWSQDVDIVSQNPITGYENIMYTLHFYAATHKEYLRNKLKQALNSGLPIFVTEFGICDASGNGNLDIEEANIWINMLNENNISWMCWNLSNKNESSSILKNTNKVTGWTEDELSECGKWLVKTLKECYEKEKITNPDFGTTIDQEVGMNGFIDDPIDILTAGGIVREYHNYGWSQGATGEMNFKNGTWWNFDEFYKKLYEAGITIFPCIQQGSTLLLKNNTNRENKPVDEGADTLNPASYKIHANYLFNYAARYGSNIVDESKLSVVSNEEKKSGLGYIRYYENWNEPDKTWLGEKAYFSPEEFAAMCSADYDGHEGTLGDVYGVKQADPNSKLVYGGLAGGSAGVEYLDRMKAWSEENRNDKVLPFDVINFHMYLGQNCPEKSNFVESASLIVNWRNVNARDKEVWITEFGWDTNTESVMAAPNEDTQRDWIIREYLIADRIGINRATAYCSRDVAPASDTTKYSTCGLTTQKGEQAKKSSWFGLKTLKTTLQGYKLEEVIKEDSNIYIYKYHNNEKDEDCYVLWCPTQDGSKIDNYELEIGKYNKAILTQMADEEEYGIKTDLNINNNIVTLNVTESPIFVTVSKPEQEEPEQEEPKEEEPKQEEPKQEEPKQEEPKQEEPKQEEPKQEEPKQEEPKQEEPKQEEPKQEEPEQEEIKQEEPKQEEPEQEEIKQEEPKQEEPKQEEPKQEEPKQEEVKQEEPEQEEPKQEEPKQEELKQEEQKQEENKADKPIPKTGDMVVEKILIPIIIIILATTAIFLKIKIHKI